MSYLPIYSSFESGQTNSLIFHFEPISFVYVKYKPIIPNPIKHSKDWFEVLKNAIDHLKWSKDCAQKDLRNMSISITDIFQKFAYYGFLLLTMNIFPFSKPCISKQIHWDSRPTPDLHDSNENDPMQWVKPLHFSIVLASHIQLRKKNFLNEMFRWKIRKFLEDNIFLWDLKLLCTADSYRFLMYF